MHLKWGVSYGGKVWLNGQSVFDNTSTLAANRYHTYNVVTESPIAKDQYDVVLPLQAGWNALIIKTNHGDRSHTAWLFSPKIGDGGGLRRNDLVFSARDINLSATPLGSSSVSLTWSAPDFHGSNVDTYLLDVAMDPGFAMPVQADVDLGKVAGHTVTGLAPGTTYYFRVKPFNASETPSGRVYWHHVDAVSATTGS
ncbi:MAG: fibronectin type III domain-containing protein [Planctomycetes bacterium]|nr:fibronectin type III domain-containing protein [Planctomycetota bacterium]